MTREEFIKKYLMGSYEQTLATWNYLYALAWPSKGAHTAIGQLKRASLRDKMAEAHQKPVYEVQLDCESHIAQIITAQQE